MRFRFLPLLSVLAAVPVWADGAAALQAMKLAREASAMIEAQEFAPAAEKLEVAIGLRPDFPPRYLELASAQAGAKQDAAALESLHRFAGFGFLASIERSPEFAGLRSRREFQDLVKRVAANGHPKGPGEVAFSLRDITGLMEGIAWREKTGEFLFGDVNGRAIWVRRQDGALRRLTAEDDGLFGVFGLALDESAGVVWAATSAVPAMRGFSPEQAGRSALAEIELETGAVRRLIPVPRAAGSEGTNLLSDVALGPDGSVWLIDGGQPLLWRLPPGGSALERAIESAEFFVLQGLTILPSGIILVADQVNGLVCVDPERRQARHLMPPANATLGDINSLTLAPDGSVLALQTGTRPNRVLRVSLEPEAEGIARVTVLESGHVAMGAPSLGCIGPEGDFCFVGHAGWSRFAAGDGTPTAPRQVPIFRTKLPKPRQ
jgi:sugar lactone lactonase YvrE